MLHKVKTGSFRKMMSELCFVFAFLFCFGVKGNDHDADHLYG